ncbi:MAG: RluA family pseudouridine synthase [Proteobacteria bacterium]|nr:RluA family pseudouridine synthase [Pseudomonadota bacterium]
MAEPPEYELEIGPLDRGRRVDQFLARGLGASRSQVRRLLAGGAVALDGRTLSPADKGAPLPSRGTIRVEGFRPPGDQRARPCPDLPLQVLARGAGWLALDKPAGVAVHPLSEPETGTLLNAVIARHPEIHGVGEGGLRSGIVHRLDVDTSGALLVATEEPAWQRLRAAFREHRVTKVYRALVLGAFEREEHLELGLVVARHRPARVRVVDAREADADPDVRVGTLDARPLELLDGATLVEVRPRTGFLHQIRASLAHLGHPVAGDRTYGPASDPTGATRHLLHAAQVAFEEVAAESPDPEDFRSHLEQLRH